MQATIQKQTKKNITRCAIYTRVSTDQQAEKEFNSCEAQEDRILSFIASQEGFVHAETYSDPGYTGANTDRPAMQKMLRDVEAGDLDMVITYKIDRLTRSPRDFYQLIEVFERHQVGFISVTERFDTSTPAGRLLRNIMLTFAQFERELASERIRDKIFQKVQRGLYPGGRPPLGYKVENHRLVIDPVAAAVTKRVFDTYAETRSLARAFDVFLENGIKLRSGRGAGNSMVWHLLRNPVLTGKIIHKGKIYPGQHAAIISQPVFDHVQSLVKNHPRQHRRPYTNMPFAGLVQCDECGSIMSASHVIKKTPDGGRRYYYYRCSRVTHHGWKSCSTRQINADRFHALVEQTLAHRAADPDYLKNLVLSTEGQTRSGEATGFEHRSLTGGYSMEKLQKSLKNFNSLCARKTGIEKTLLVQEGIQKVHYSKESVGVDFYWERFIDGVEPSAAPARPAAPPKTERPTPAYGVGPSLQSSTHKMVSPTGIEPVLQP